MRIIAITVSATLLIAGPASAQGISLFGDARLGLGYNVDNDGGVVLDADGEPLDELRAVSRIRFGVNMTGETDSGITFGGSIRADNAPGGEGGNTGQTEGNVFVSGAWGTLTFGDTNAADEQWVGDVPGNYSLTELAEINETQFVSNGGSYGEDNGQVFAENPFARPTIRYDFDIAGFGISVSSNRDLTDVGVGTGYATDFGGGSWSVGVGYYKFDSFVTTGDSTVVIVEDVDGNPVSVEGDPVEFVIPDGEQWSVGLKAEYESFAFGVTYTTLSSDTEADGDVESDNLLLGASFGFDAVSVGAFYGKVLTADGDEIFGELDGDDAYGLTARYDLGGGASINGGIAKSYDYDGDATIGDFGISMAF